MWEETEAEEETEMVESGRGRGELELPQFS